MTKFLRNSITISYIMILQTLVSLPKTLEWKQIQFSERNSFPWYRISFCRAQVKPKTQRYSIIFKVATTHTKTLASFFALFFFSSHNSFGYMPFDKHCQTLKYSKSFKNIKKLRRFHKLKFNSKHLKKD